LTELEIGSTRKGIAVAVDCSGINGIDMSGFQLLYVWLHCIELSGLHPELVNMPEWMRETQEVLGVTQVFDNDIRECRFV